MERGSAAIVAAASILGLCIVGGAWLIARSVQDATSTLDEMGVALSEFGESLDGLQVAAPAAAARPAARGPDPNRKYTVNTKDAPVRGAEDAPVTVVEFSDFQCPFCSRTLPTLDRLRQEYGDKVRLVFKHFPLESIHPRARGAHVAAEAAGMQGKFWEMHDKIFANQRALSDAQYLTWAEEIGLDLDRFKKDIASAEVQARIQRDLDEASGLGITGTPAFFINGRHLSGARPYPDFKRMVDRELEG